MEFQQQSEHPSRRVSRRRAITIIGVAAGSAAVGGAAWIMRDPRELERIEWTGVALGSPARIVLFDTDPSRARQLLAEVSTDIEYFEEQFSLYRPRSAISRLNATGRLARPDPVFVNLLEQSASFSALTEGAFDPTVQPVWNALSESFRSSGAPPAPEVLDGLRPLVDWRGVQVATDLVEFARPDMALTLNGIAQGFITDRVADRLKSGGLRHVLVELGETRAIGEHPQGRPWQIGIPDPGGEDLIETLTLGDEAIATSGGYGTRFDSAGEWHHIFDPATARSAHRHRSVSVVAPTATEADALATAFVVMPEEAAAALVAERRGVRARVVDTSGVARALGA